MGKYFNRFAIPVFIILTLSMVDILITAFTHSKSTFSVMAGEEVNMSGDLAKAVDEAWFTAQDPTPVQRLQLMNQILGYTPQADFLRLKFKEVRGRFWRGTLYIENQAPQGDITVNVFQHSHPAKLSSYTVQIFHDPAAYKANLPSFSERLIGVPPWVITLFLFPLGAILILINFLQSGKRDLELQSAGIGPIYKLAKLKDHWEVSFGLGSQHGVQVGDSLILLDESQEPVGEILADVVKTEFTTAVVPLGIPITPQYLIARRQ